MELIEKDIVQIKYLRLALEYPERLCFRDEIAPNGRCTKTHIWTIVLLAVWIIKIDTVVMVFTVGHRVGDVGVVCTAK